MIRDITLGQYYQADSVIHKLDPRVKLVGTLIYIMLVTQTPLMVKRDIRFYSFITLLCRRRPINAPRM